MTPVDIEPRLSPLSQDACGADALAIVVASAEAHGFKNVKIERVPEFVATMMRNAELWRRHSELTARFYLGALEYRDVELVLLRTAWLCKAAFMFGAHVPSLKRRCGATSDDIERLIQGSTAPGWDDRTRALLRAAEELHETSTLSDETWALLASHLNDKQLIELPLLIGHLKGVACVQNALRIRLEPGNQGLESR